MNNPLSKWALLMSAIGAIATLGAAANAFGELVPSDERPAAVSEAKDKICVVSQNTGLAMWYNAKNHGFSPVVAAGSGFAPTEQLIFGGDHQLTLGAFDAPSVFAVDLGGSAMSHFVVSASKGFGAPVGFVFGKDRQLYLTSRSPQSTLQLIDPTGSLVEATLAHGRAIRTELKVLALSPMAAVPEPSSIALLGLAGAALLARRWRRA